MPARKVASLLQAFREEAARLHARVPALGLSPLAQGQVRMVLHRLEADSTTDGARRGVLDGYLAARLEERLALLRDLPALVAAHQASAPPAPDDDGLWIAALAATRLHPHAPRRDA